MEGSWRTWPSLVRKRSSRWLVGIARSVSELREGEWTCSVGEPFEQGEGAVDGLDTVGRPGLTRF